MTPKRFFPSIPRWSFASIELILIAIAVFLLLFQPGIWGQGHSNWFALGLTRVWTEDTLSPSSTACQSSVDDLILDDMQLHLEQMDDRNPRKVLYRMAMACLKGDQQQVEALWSPDIGETLHRQIAALWSTVSAYSRGNLLVTPYATVIGEYGYNQCLARQRNRDIPSAVTWCEFAFAVQPNRAATSRMELLYRELNDEVSAQQILVRLSANLTQDAPDYWWAIGKIAEGKEDWLGAALAYAQAAELSNDEIESFEYYLGAGRLWLQAAEYQQAEAALRSAAILQPENINVYLSLAALYRQQGLNDIEEEVLLEAREIDSENASIVFLLGANARRQGDYEQALVFFNQSYALGFDRQDVYYYKALALDNMQRRQEAIEALIQAINGDNSAPQEWHELLRWWQRYPVFSDDPERWAEEAQTAQKESDWPAAATLYQTAADQAQGEDALTYQLQAAEMWFLAQEYDNSEAAFRQVLAFDPGQIDAHMRIGDIFLRREAYSVAEQWYRDTIAIAPDRGDAFYKLGIVLYRMEQYNDAFTSFEQSLSAGFENPEAFYYRSLTLKALGREMEAIEALAQAVEAHQNPPQGWRDLLLRWRQGE